MIVIHSMMVVNISQKKIINVELTLIEIKGIVGIVIFYLDFLNVLMYKNIFSSLISILNINILFCYIIILILY